MSSSTQCLLGGVWAVVVACWTAWNATRLPTYEGSWPFKRSYLLMSAALLLFGLGSIVVGLRRRRRERESPFRLNNDEWHAVQCLQSGLTVPAMADRLGAPEDTVRLQLTNAADKLRLAGSAPTEPGA